MKRMRVPRSHTPECCAGSSSATFSSFVCPCAAPSPLIRIYSQAQVQQAFNRLLEESQELQQSDMFQLLGAWFTVYLLISDAALTSPSSYPTNDPASYCIYRQPRRSSPAVDRQTDGRGDGDE